MKKLLAFLVLIAWLLPAIADTTVQFVDVGQGDCTIVKSAGQTLMVDTGPPGARMAVEACLTANGIDRIDTLVLTHPHEDHDGLLGYLASRGPIGALYMPEYADDEEDYGDLLRKLVGKGTRIIYPGVGDQFAIGDATVTVLSAADPARFPDNINLWSIVLRIADGPTSVIVTGDAEDINEFAMIDAGMDLDADILRVGHHGSHTSTSGAFLDTVMPTVAVVSCGAGNSYGHPHQVVLDALYDRQIPVMRTDINGTVTVRIDAEAYAIQTEK
ncbi:ComEC/Rec2 family competence protein [Bacillota bacterium Meth-B3]